MVGYLSADIICSEKRTVFRERSSRKTVSYEEQNCHSCVMTFPQLCNDVSSIYQLFVPHFAMAVLMCVYLHYPDYRINKQRDKSFEFSSIISTVDLSKHLITAWIIRKFIQLVNFVAFSVFFFLFGNRSSMVKSVWAGSFGKWAASTYKNVRARIYSM